MPKITVCAEFPEEFNVRLPSNSRNRMSPSKTRRRWKQILKRDGNRCHYCKKLLIQQQITLDHKHPFSQGGSDCLDNLVIACRPCNERKGNILYDDFLRLLNCKSNYLRNKQRYNFPENPQP